MCPLRRPQRPAERLVTLSRATPPQRGSRRSWRAFWITAFLAGGVVDVWRMSKKDGTTLSETIRWGFGTDTPLGKVEFLCGLAALGWHILNP